MCTLSELFKDILPDENTEREDNYVYAARNFNNDYNIKQELYVFNSPIERDIFCAIKNEEENMYDGYNCTIWKGVDIRVSQPYMYTGDHFDKIIDIYLKDRDEIIQIESSLYKIKVPRDINLLEYFIEKELKVAGLTWCATSTQLDKLLQKVEHYKALGYIPMEE